MTDGRCEKHDNWHAECRRCLEEAGYARGVADERARVVADLRALALAADHELDDSLRGLADRYERGEHTKEGA